VRHSFAWLLPRVSREVEPAVHVTTRGRLEQVCHPYPDAERVLHELPGWLAATPLRSQGGTAAAPPRLRGRDPASHPQTRPPRRHPARVPACRLTCTDEIFGKHTAGGHAGPWLCRSKPWHSYGTPQAAARIRTVRVRGDIADGTACGQGLVKPGTTQWAGARARRIRMRAERAIGTVDTRGRAVFRYAQSARWALRFVAGTLGMAFAV
jgi:hypothetical protein